MPNEDVTHFTEVDQTKDPAFFARFLDEGNKLPAIRYFEDDHHRRPAPPRGGTGLGRGVRHGTCRACGLSRHHIGRRGCDEPE